MGGTGRVGNREPTTLKLPVNKSTMDQFREKDGRLQKLVFCKFIKKKGKVIYHPKGGVFAFWVNVTN